MPFLLSLLAFITTPPGSWLHTIGLLVALEAPVALAFNRWWAGSGRGRGVAPPPGGATRHRAAQARLAVAAGSLFLLRVVGLGATLLIPAGTPDALVVLPPLERATATLTALLLLWAFAYPEPNLKADLSTAGLAAAAFLGLGLAWNAWAAAVVAGASFYNGSLDETLWLLASGLILAVGVGRLASGRLPGWRAGAVLLGVLLVGHLLHYLFPPAGVDAPAAVRWAELAALPLAMLLLYRRAQAWPLAQPAPAAEAAASRPQLFRSPLWQLAETFLIAAVFYFGIEFTTGRFRVEGPSMQPTLAAGQFVLTDRLAYRLGRPQRGDIVVIHPAGDPLAGESHDLIKRVIGLPGEHIAIAEGVVHIDGQPYGEPYLREPGQHSGLWALGPDEYFVLGDNRNNSSDSHVWGPLHGSAFNSRALLVYWPPPAWTWVAGTPLAAAPAGP